MKETQITATKKRNRLVFITKVVLLVLSMITAIPMFNTAFRDAYKLCCAWSVILVIWLFIKNRKSYMKKEYILFLLFCCSYAVTIFLNINEHFINEVAMLGFTGMLFFMLTYCDTKLTKEEAKEELIKMAWIIVIISFVYSVINFILLIVELGGIVDMTDVTFIHGMVDNRLGGIYNPNTGASVNYIAFIVSLILIKEVKKKKPFLIANVILQFICFAATQSRSGWVCLLGFTFIYFIFVNKKEKFRGIKKYAVRVVAAVLACTFLVVGSNIARSVVWTGASLIRMEEEGGDKPKKVDSKRVKVDESSANGVSAGRLHLWQVAMKEYKDVNPVMGIGFRSIDDVLKEGLTKGEYKNSAQGGLHNVYVTILVSSGIVGLLIFAIFAIFMLKRVLDILISKNIPEYVKCLAAFIPVWLLGDLVESRIMLGMNYLAVCFWIVVGYVLYYSEGYRHGKHHHSGV